ncbi:MAG TPA: dihydroorotase [Thermoplasmata archaeon]|nr:dihydroorotase [Thermoplasmata archaeon]
MAKLDAVVEGKVLLDTGLVDCCIGIVDGKIAKIAKTIGKADERHDFSGRIVMPAGIDLHVHFREPGMTKKEDFRTGSTAAACGGVTFVLDMPNTKPPTRTVAEIREKISRVSKKSFVDFGLAALLNPKSDAERLAKEATAFKIYLGETTGNLGIAPVDLSASISRAGERQVFIHAEHLGKLDDTVEAGLRDHDLQRSESHEVEAVSKVISARGGVSKVHLLHVTQAEVLELAKLSGVTAEVTPHHLLLDSGSTLGTMGKINPPLRSKATRMRLWDAFSSGKADTLGSDHSPHTIGEKEVEFNEAPSGMPGVETLVPLMLQKVAERKLNISLLSRYCSRKPARICGLKKGRIAVGYDADLIAVDLRRSIRIRADELHSKCGWTPYEGMHAVFPLATFLRGEEIAREGELSGDRIGRFVRPEGEDR